MNFFSFYQDLPASYHEQIGELWSDAISNPKLLRDTDLQEKMKLAQLYFEETK